MHNSFVSSLTRYEKAFDREGHVHEYTCMSENRRPLFAATTSTVIQRNKLSE